MTNIFNFLMEISYKHVKIVRLLNLPTSVPDEDIRTIASNWGGSVDAERLPRPFKAIKSFKRSYATAVVSTPLDVGHTAPPINQLDVAREVTACAPMVNSSLILSKRLPYCRKCKQQGHNKQDCPRHTISSNKVMINDDNEQINEGGDMNQHTPTINTTGSSDIDATFSVVTRVDLHYESPHLMAGDEEREVIAPVLTRDVALNEFNQAADVNYFQSMPGGNVEQISCVSAFQHQVLIDAFKNADKELKRMLSR
ncbi:unnamed protein product [Rotaria socialis]